MAKQFTHTVKVVGFMGKSFPFPVDMLRYDDLAPANETDSKAIERSITPQPTTGSPVVYTLKRQAPVAWKPTSARWESFMFNILSHEVKDPARGQVAFWFNVKAIERMTGEQIASMIVWSGILKDGGHVHNPFKA